MELYHTRRRVGHGDPVREPWQAAPNRRQCQRRRLVWWLVKDYDNTWWVNRYTAGSGWGGEIILELAAHELQIAMDANGDGLAVWSQYDGPGMDIWARGYTDGTWSPGEQINTTGREAFAPQIAIDADGNGLAVWAQSDDTGIPPDIWARRYTAGTWSSPPERIETSDGGAYPPQIAIDANGNGLAVWVQHDGIHHNIWANRYTGGSDWGVAELLETNNDGDARGPQIAVDANGNGLAVWYQHDGTRNNIWANRYTAGTGWGMAERIEANDGDAVSPQIAVDANGNGLTVWSQNDGTRDNIWANRYTAGTGWGEAELLETDDDGDAVDPQIAVDANGNGLAVWYQHDGTRDNIWANRYTADSGWGTAELIEASDDTVGGHPLQIAVDANGNGLAVWNQQDNVWVNRFE